MLQLTFCSSRQQPAAASMWFPLQAQCVCHCIVMNYCTHCGMPVVHALQLTAFPIKPMVMASHALPGSFCRVSVQQCGAGPTLDIVEEDVLKEDDRIVAADGALQQRLGIGCCGACHQLHSRNGLEVGLQALAMLCAQLATHATWPSDHHWHLQRACYGHVLCHGKSPKSTTLSHKHNSCISCNLHVRSWMGSH